jgi:hypothetical protein
VTRPDAAEPLRADHRAMETYAVVWIDPAGPVSAGKLELVQDGLRLEGGRDRVIPYAEIERLHVGRRVTERVRGRPSLVLDLTGGERLRIGSVGAPGTLHELAERVAGLAMHRVPA